MTTRPTATGRLRYDPRADGLATLKWWLLLQCDGDWYRRLQADVKGKMPQHWRMVTDPDRNTGKTADPPHLALTGKMLRPNWGCHIAILRGQPPTQNRHLWGKDSGYSIEFEYDPDPRYNNEYIWYDVWCGDLLEMRENYGFSRDLKGRRRDILHLTVARWEGVEPNIPWGESRRFK